MRIDWGVEVSELYKKIADTELTAVLEPPPPHPPGRGALAIQMGPEPSLPNSGPAVWLGTARGGATAGLRGRPHHRRPPRTAAARAATRTVPRPGKQIEHLEYVLGPQCLSKKLGVV